MKRASAMLIAVSILAGVMCMTSCGKKDAPSKEDTVSTEQKNTDKKYEMLLSEEASIKADEVTAHCIFRNTDYDSISEQYGIMKLSILLDTIWMNDFRQPRIPCYSKDFS